MARTSQPLVKLLDGAEAVAKGLREQVSTSDNPVWYSETVKKESVKVLDQLARALRKVPVAAKTE